MPANFCPYCEVDLRDATRPKKVKTPLLRRLVTAVIILLCVAVVYALIKRLVDGGAFQVFRKYKAAMESVEPLPARAWRGPSFLGPPPANPPAPSGRSPLDVRRV
jgi:hypothetical protein